MDGTNVEIAREGLIGESSLFESAAIASHPLLRALEATRYGTLSVVTPENRRLMFVGPEPGLSARLEIRDWRALDEIVARGQMGFAESYIAGHLECDDLPALLTFLLMNVSAIRRYFYGKPWHALWSKLRFWLHPNSLSGSRRNIAAHYDLGNDFYALWLDRGMTYSCALFGDDPSRDLEDAQEAKYCRILTKLDARPGDHILEIGCGWGGFAEIAARTGLRVTALTLSEPQADYARARLERAGLSSLAKIELRDYREVGGQYDHIVSIGMFEHVGEKYWQDYFAAIRDRLKPGGRAMIQSITIDEELFKYARHKVDFIQRYIFPGGMLPSPSRFRLEVDLAGLETREVFAFGQHYKRTLEHWLRRFEAKKAEIHALGYDEAFIRIWRFYLATCIATFATGRTNVMQVKLMHAPAA